MGGGLAGAGALPACFKRGSAVLVPPFICFSLFPFFFSSLFVLLGFCFFYFFFYFSAGTGHGFTTLQAPAMPL